MSYTNSIDKARSAASTANAPLSAFEIEREFETLHSRLGQLDDSLHKLTERMSCVLNDPAPITPTDELGESDPRSPYGRRIRSLRHMVERLNALVETRLLEDLAI